MLNLNHGLWNPHPWNPHPHHAALPLNLGLGWCRSCQFAVHADSHLVYLQEKCLFKVTKGQIPEAISFRFEDQRPGVAQNSNQESLVKSNFKMRWGSSRFYSPSFSIQLPCQGGDDPVNGIDSALQAAVTDEDGTSGLCANMQDNLVSPILSNRK